MRQSYAKYQHEFAKEHKRALITIGWEGRHLKKPSGSAIFTGPATASELKQIKALFMKILKYRPKGKQ